MMLSEWMTENKRDDGAVASQLGVARSTVTRHRNGDRMPSLEQLDGYRELTNGKVTAEDFANACRASRSSKAIKASHSANLEHNGKRR